MSTGTASSPVFRLDPDPGADWNKLVSSEWLETNGRGSFASGTVAQCATRRYHGLIVARPHGNQKRHVFLARYEEFVHIDGVSVPLSVANYGDTFEPRGHENLKSFELAPYPRWTFRIGDVEVQKELALVRDEDAAICRWRVRGSAQPVRLELRPMLAFREADALTIQNDELNESLTTADSGWSIQPYDALPPLHWSTDGDGSFEADGTWYNRVTYERDVARGYDGEEDQFCPGALSFSLEDGDDVVLAASVGKPVDSPRATWNKLQRNRRRAVRKAVENAPENGPLERISVRAQLTADDFLYTTEHGRLGVDAGYPWFGEWGRDTFIALPGLTLSRGKPKECAKALSGAIEFLKGGLLPNIYGRSVEDSHYGSVDAALWFARAVRLYEVQGGSARRFQKEYLPTLLEIAESYLRGTELSDAADSQYLIRSGSVTVNATWMDAETSRGPVTPRAGYAIEINALWYSLLYHLEKTFDALGHERDKERWKSYRRTAKKAFLDRFWLEDSARLADVWSPDTPDTRIRPNMVIAAALEWSPLSRSQRAAVVDCAREELLTPRGLRTLARRDPGYRGEYGGSVEDRDSAYHQGTVWPWLMGFFTEATLRANGNGKATRRMLAGLWAEIAEDMDERGLNHLSEVFDGDAPHSGGGTIAQAWNTAELLRSIAAIEKGGG